MIDTATNWFYGERRLSAGAAIEESAARVVGVAVTTTSWLRLVKKRCRPIWPTACTTAKSSRLEFEPRQYVILRASQRERVAAEGLHARAGHEAALSVSGQAGPVRDGVAHERPRGALVVHAGRADV